MAPTFFPTPYRTCVDDETTPQFRGVVRKCECSADCHTCEHDGINAGRCLNCRNGRVLDTDRGDCFDERLCSKHRGRGQYSKVCTGVRYNASVVFVAAGINELSEEQQRSYREYFATLGAFFWPIHGSDTLMRRSEILRQATRFTDDNLCDLTTPETPLVDVATTCAGTVSNAGTDCHCGSDCHACAFTPPAVGAVDAVGEFGACTKCRNGAVLIDGACHPEEDCWGRDRGHVVEGNGNYGLECVCDNNATAFAQWMRESGYSTAYDCHRMRTRCTEAPFNNVMQTYCQRSCGLC